MKPVKLSPRTMRTNACEREAWNNNTYLVGVDEVGRGCLAGPVVTAAVILPPYTQYRLLKDSKHLKQEDREKACCWITRHAWYAWSLVDPHLINTYNIYHATIYAMRRAVTQLLIQTSLKPETLLIDSVPMTYTDTFSHIYHVNQGEHVSSTIAAASIYAKVQRDRIMRDMHTIFPAYQLYRHKGYSTPQHKQQLTQFGPSFMHRKNFITWLDRSSHGDATYTSTSLHGTQDSE